MVYLYKKFLGPTSNVEVVDPRVIRGGSLMSSDQASSLVVPIKVERLMSL